MLLRDLEYPEISSPPMEGILNACMGSAFIPLNQRGRAHYIGVDNDSQLSRRMLYQE
jgi:hypothetical protein